MQPKNKKRIINFTHIILLDFFLSLTLYSYCFVIQLHKISPDNLLHCQLSSRVTGYENKFLGNTSRVYSLVKKKLKDHNKGALDTISYGQYSCFYLYANFYEKKNIILSFFQLVSQFCQITVCSLSNHFCHYWSLFQNLFDIGKDFYNLI